MPRHSRASLKEDFVNFTGTTLANATKWLDAYNWKLEEAVDAYLEKMNASNQKVTTPKVEPKLIEIFESYQDQSDANVIGIDGTIKYIEDLGFQPEDIVVLCLAELLESSSVGLFERNLFLENWTKVGAKSLSDMTSYLNTLRKNLSTNETYFKKIYTFTFSFLLEENQRILPSELALDYWSLLLSSKYPHEIELWTNFIENEWKKPISKDYWNMFYLFIKELHSNPKMENYDETAAWPSIMDSFVEYLKDNGLI